MTREEHVAYVWTFVANLEEECLYLSYENLA